MLGASLPPWAKPYDSPRPSPAAGPGAYRGSAIVVDRQRQVSDCPGEVQRTVLAVLAIMIRINGLLTYAKLRSVAAGAGIGVIGTRRYALTCLATSGNGQPE